MNFIFRWRKIILLFTLSIFFMYLGFWQLSRAVEKKHMLSMASFCALQAPTLWSLGLPLPTQYQNIQVKGHFLAQNLLLDNQHANHLFGYDVLSPLVLEDEYVVLVDRGWIQGDITRKSLPQIGAVDGEFLVRGSVYYPSTKHWLLGEAIEIKNTQMAIIEIIDEKLIALFLHKKVVPFIIRLGKQEQNGYLRNWAVVAMSPERHYGYAVQWFAIALLSFGLMFLKKS